MSDTFMIISLSGRIALEYLTNSLLLLTIAPNVDKSFIKRISQGSTFKL